MTVRMLGAHAVGADEQVCLEGGAAVERHGDAVCAEASTSTTRLS